MVIVIIYRENELCVMKKIIPTFQLLEFLMPVAFSLSLITWNIFLSDYETDYETGDPPERSFTYDKEI